MRLSSPALLAVLLSCVLAGRAAALQSNSAPAPFAPRIDAILAAEPASRAHWGIAVVDAETGESVYTRSAAKLFVPASTLKLVVASAAAHLLDPGFRYTTSLLADGPVEDGVLAGDLVIQADGDPTISGRYADSLTAIFASLADSLARRGVRTIRGNIVVDESAWDQQYIHGDWETYDVLWWYAAPVAPLGFNDNSIDFRVAPGRAGEPARITWQPETRYFAFRNNTVTVPPGNPRTLDFERVHGTDTIRAYGQIPADAQLRTEYFSVTDPARYAATVFREVLERKGIEVGKGDIRVTRTTPGGVTLLAQHRSPRLDSLIAPILRRSQNWFAEQLLKTLGHEKSGLGTWDAGIEVERAFLTGVIRIDASEFVLRDASGLSGGNLITPSALARLLHYIAKTPRQAPVRVSLPVAGEENGSLRSRLSDLRGRVRAKTGSIRNVASLAGFATAANGRELAFVIIANGTGVSATRTNTSIDEIVRAIVAR